MVELCIVCNKEVRPRQHVLTCDICYHCQHRTCGTRISIEDYRNAVSSGGDLHFVCGPCLHQKLNATATEEFMEMESSFDPPDGADISDDDALDASFDLSHRLKEDRAETVDTSIDVEPELPSFILPDEPITFTVFETGSKRGGRLLVSSDGFSYGVKHIVFADLGLLFRACIQIVRMGDISTHGNKICLKMADDSDIPPLEDMTELLSQVKTMGMKGSDAGDASLASNSKNSQPTAINSVELENGTNSVEYTKIKSPKCGKLTQNENKIKTSNSGSPSEHKTTETFGGFKKGFLFGASSNKKTEPKQKQGKDSIENVETIPYIKKTDEKSTDSKLHMPDVQNAMREADGLLQNTEWVTEDLLTKVQKSSTLSKRLADPSFMQAISEFQSNPKAAMTKYANNPEMQKFLQEFCGIMGEHFTNLSSKEDAQNSRPVQELGSPQQRDVLTRMPPDGVDISVHSSTDPKQQSQADQQNMEKILADPQIRDLLLDPWIQKLFETLRNDPSGGQRLLQNADSEKKQKIKKLVDAGLLQFEVS
ncbi:hypothetical protein ScPMuIL_012492 [Solemya velum]